MLTFERVCNLNLICVLSEPPLKKKQKKHFSKYLVMVVICVIDIYEKLWFSI